MAGGRNRAHEALKILAPVRLQTLVVRHEPAEYDAAALDAHTRAWAQAINESGKAFLTPAVIEGRWAVRVSIGAAATSREHVAELRQLMREAARNTQAGNIQEGAER